MNQKTWITDPLTKQRTWSWTHERTRKAYNSLNHLWRNQLLFVYLDPPDGVLDSSRIKSTTNSLEGGINAQLKLPARTHRGRSGEHQRRMLEWWLYLKTELPDDPVEIARQSNWGQDQLAKVSTLTHNENQADHETSTTSPLRQRYRYQLHTLNRHPKRPHLAPRHADTRHTF